MAQAVVPGFWYSFLALVLGLGSCLLAHVLGLGSCVTLLAKISVLEFVLARQRRKFLALKVKFINFFA